jgi:hypothetical protein
MDVYPLIAIAHLAVIVPLLLYVGFNRAATPEWIYAVLFGLGILVLAYHGYRGFARWAAGSQLVWIHAVHVALVAPVLLWIGYNGKKTERPAYEILLMLAFAALGHHMYKLIVVAQTYVKPAEI